MNYFFIWFAKITGYPVQLLFFKKKIYYQDKMSQSRKISGGALIISNHESVLDFPLIMFTFIKRTVIVLIAKSTYNINKIFTSLMRQLGSIVVDRKSYDFAFMSEAESKLKDNKTVLIFPEGRLKLPEERKTNELLEFKPSFVYIALNSGKPIIPVYTNGQYGFKNLFTKKRARIIIGKKIYAKDLYDEKKSEEENIKYICSYVKKKVEALGESLADIQKKEEAKANIFARIFDIRMWMHDFIKLTGCLPVLLDLRLKKIYIKNGKKVKKPKGLYSGSSIVMSNHFSFRDPVILMNTFWMRRINFICLKEFFEKLVSKITFTCFGCIPIDRKKPSLETFKLVKRHLNHGHLVALFPEGAIETGDDLTKYKSGGALLAIMNDVPIIPVYIKKRKHWYQRQEVYIGEKIYYEGTSFPSLDKVNELTKICENKEKELKKASGD